MSLLKCPYNDNLKEYIIPNNTWIEPIFENVLYKFKCKNIKELINSRKILAKITPFRNNQLVEFNCFCKNMPNIVKTYETIKTNSNFICDNDTKPNYSITIELMKKYNSGSLKELKYLTIKQFKNILLQLVLCQLNIFGKNSYTHNNIHIGNILIHKHNNKKELKYKFINTEILPTIISSKYEFILSDYNDYVSFRGEIKNFRKQKLYKYSLLNNLIETIKMLIHMLDNYNRDLIKKLFDNINTKYLTLIKNKYGIILKLYLNKDIEYRDFKSLVLYICEYYIIIFLNIFSKGPKDNFK